jgi:hypothetical protein
MTPGIERRSLLAGLGAAAGTMALALAPLGAAETPEDQRLLSDWPNLARYRDQNLELQASGARIDAVFLGDSITEGWLSKVP